jgi:hypothetical protein
VLTVTEAIRRGRAFESEGIAWLEEPIRHDDYVGSAAIARALAVPLQIGENFNGPESMLEALGAAACDYVTGPQYCSGPLKTAVDHLVEIGDDDDPASSGTAGALTAFPVMMLALDELGGLDSKQRRALLYIIAGLDEKLDDTAGIRRKHRCGRLVAIGNLPFGRVLGPEARQLHRHNLQVLPLCIGRRSSALTRARSSENAKGSVK